MIEQLWDKQVVIEVQLCPSDTADWTNALPLIFNAHWNHYIGFYNSLIQQFYEPYQPFPYQLDYFWLELAHPKIQLNGTEIISHLFALYSLAKKRPLQLICHFRRSQPSPIIDLKQFFKSSLKASTCIRYGKFGSSVVTVEMTVGNIDDMFTNFRGNRYNDYLGQLGQESTKLGYQFIVANPDNNQKIQKIPIKIIGQGIGIERGASRSSTLGYFLQQLLGMQQTDQTSKIVLFLHGVPLKDTQVTLAVLEKYCHPDGYLYFTF